MTHQPLDTQVRQLREALSSLVLNPEVRGALLSLPAEQGMGELLAEAQKTLRNTGSRRDKDETDAAIHDLRPGGGMGVELIPEPPVDPGPTGAEAVPEEAVRETPRNIDGPFMDEGVAVRASQRRRYAERLNGSRLDF